MQIVLPSNMTTVTLPHVKNDWVFSVAGNTVRGSTGLTANWLCMYDYHATPSIPQFLSVDSLLVDSVVVQWVPLQCDSDNRARVLHYIIDCLNNKTGNMHGTLYAAISVVIFENCLQCFIVVGCKGDRKGIWPVKTLHQNPLAMMVVDITGRVTG